MTAAPESDAELVLRANRGDSSAFEALYERYRDWILRSARVVTGDDDLAADCLQEVLAYWLSKFPGFTLQGKVTTFLYPCVRHVALELLRRRGMVVDPAEVAEAEWESRGTAEAGAAGADPRMEADIEILRQRFESLSLEQREVLHLHVVEGIPLAELSLSLGIPIGTVKSRLHHGLERLRGRD